MLELTTSNNASAQKQILELILKAFIDLRLTWNEQVITQIKSAEITFEDCRSSYFFDFSYHTDIPKLQVTKRVPVLIDFCSKFLVENETIHELKNRPNFYWVKEMENVTPPFQASGKANSYISTQHAKNQSKAYDSTTIYDTYIHLKPQHEPHFHLDLYVWPQYPSPPWQDTNLYQYLP